MRPTLFTIALSIACSAAVPASAESIRLVRAEHLSCVLANIEEYQSLETSPVEIVYADCPFTDTVAQAKSEAAQNSAYPSGRADEDEVFVENYTAYEPHELECLESLKIGELTRFAENEEYVVLPNEVCSDE